MPDSPLEVKSAWRITTFCPMDIPLGLQLGFRQDSPECIQFLNAIEAIDQRVSVDRPEASKHSDAFSGSEYLDTQQDVSTIRLFTWCYENDDSEVVFHVFPLKIAICEIRLQGLYAADATELDKLALSRAERAMHDAADAFNKMLKKAKASAANEAVTFEFDDAEAKVYWPSRTILINKEELEDNRRQAVIRKWLKDTHRPQDAQAIIDGEKKESMTWLKYVMVNPVAPQDARAEAMILAQYCYTAQEKCNRQLRLAIEWAFSGEKGRLESELQRAKRVLEQSRVMAKLHNVSVNECLRHLTRDKRRLIEDIFECWEYQRLVDNGHLMLELCEDKIQESNSRQAKISAYKTEYILIGISLFTVLEFFFFITQFSREAMANPTLDHNDGGPSSFLTWIAEIPADWMFFIGVIFAGFIFLIYKKVKG